MFQWGHLSELMVATHRLEWNKITFITSYDERSADVLEGYKHKYY